ncbi:MAG: DNA polymerase III subunit delta', partial [Chloroflexi bacterium]|nr:DNA polymerase III subunit delta' [Chloroflexota bacterium]
KADLLTHEAANSLLKTLEEPSPHVLIILLTSREKNVLPTIVSRCQRVEMHPLPPSTVRDVLTKRYAAPEETADLLARVSCGRIGWAIEALQDQGLIEKRNQTLDALSDLKRADTAKRLVYAAEMASEFGKHRESVRDAMDLWLGWWHDLLLVNTNHSELVTNVDRRKLLTEQARDLAPRQITSFIQQIQEAGVQLEQNANPRLVFEVLMLCIP